jgi:hypothetical protein
VMLLIAMIAVSNFAWSQDQDAPKEQGAKPEQTDAVKEASKKRLEIMQEAIDLFQVTSKEVRPESALKPVKTPKLRYDDQVRGLLDAAVWRIGEEGRATAYVTMELYSSGQPGMEPIRNWAC